MNEVWMSTLRKVHLECIISGTTKSMQEEFNIGKRQV